MAFPTNPNGCVPAPSVKPAQVMPRITDIVNGSFIKATTAGSIFPPWLLLDEAVELSPKLLTRKGIIMKVYTFMGRSNTLAKPTNSTPTNSVMKGNMDIPEAVLDISHMALRRSFAFSVPDPLPNVAYETSMLLSSLANTSKTPPTTYIMCSSSNFILAEPLKSVAGSRNCSNKF
mmetsp:Transcript_77716/g.141346  ORF Transcript_77716/g.141346 Transcript_77716/m.141346 type:complete len:175 (-) Transcript_77716:390-914(-)